MRNRIARLITIGLTTVSMTLTALSGAAPITLTAQAAPNDPATQATPNGEDPVATRGGVTYERDYDKGAVANGRKVVYYEDKYGAKDNYPNKYKGAEIKNPEYPADYKPDPDSNHYTFMIAQPQLNYLTNQNKPYNNTNDYIVFSVDPDDLDTIHFKVMSKGGTSVKKTYQIKRNSSSPGLIYKDSSHSYLQTGTDSVDAYGGVMVAVDNRSTSYNVRSYMDGIYLDGDYVMDAHKDGSIRQFTLDQSMKDDKDPRHVLTDLIPSKATQTTKYIGILDDGSEVLLDTFVMNGMTGQTYTAPGPNSYKGWIYDASKEPASRSGIMGKAYEPGTKVKDSPTDGYIREWEVLDDAMTVRASIYRVVPDDEKYLLRTSDVTIEEKGNTYVRVFTKDIRIGKEVGMYSSNDASISINSRFGTMYYSVPGYTYSQPWIRHIGIRNPFRQNPTDIVYYYKLAPAEPVSPETPGVKSEGAQTTIKKALELVNVAHDYIPSVPDVIFNYEVVYDLYGTVVYDDGTETYGKDKTPVGYLVQGIDAGGFPSIRVGVDKGVATDIYDNGPDSIYEDKKIKDSFGNETTVLDANGNPVRTLKKEALYARYTPVAYGKDINDTEFEIWRGPIGGIQLTDVETGVQSHKGTVRFHHDDYADENEADNAKKPIDGTGKELEVRDGQNNLITKKLQVEIVEDAFKAPGVYRYILQERGGDERAMTEWDHADEKGKTESAVLDDIEHKVEKEIRYLDIYVEWNGTEDKLIVKDMVLHNISGKLDYATHGSFGLEKEGGTDNSGQSTALLGTEGKKDAFTESTYTTYDLVVGKEIMGKGLTNYDITERVFTFKVTINAPSYTLIKAARGAETTSGNINWRFPVPTDGKLVPGTKSKDGQREFYIKVKQGEWVLLSGIPSGATYEVEEVDDWSDPNSANSALFENYYSTNMKEMIEDPNNRSIRALAGQNNKSMLEDQPRRNTYMMTLQNRLDAQANGKEFVNSTQEELVDDLVNVSGEMTKTTGAITMSKYVNDQLKKSKDKENPASNAIDNVFFLNLRRDNVVTGVAMSVAPYALMVAAAVIGVGGFLIVKKRRDADLDED